MDEAPEQLVSLAELSALSGVSRFQLLRGLVRAVGIMPPAYVLQQRVPLARRLLVAGRRPAQAAAQAGFADQSHLTRAFRRQLGVTPGRYRFEANRVATLRTRWRIPCFQPKPKLAEGDVMTVAKAAATLNVAPSTLHRWLNDGLIAGEQVTPGAPWRIRMTDDLKASFTASAGEGCITMQEATRVLGVTRQTVLQRVKRGEIEAAHVTKGGQVGLRIKLAGRQTVHDRR